MKLIYPAIFTPCLEKEGYTIVVLVLPRCVSEGDSLLKSKGENLYDAVSKRFNKGIWVCDW